MSIDVKYRTTATAVGGRDGRAYTKFDALDLEMTTPRELGGSGEEGTNPEQLFAAGYSACFLSALKMVGRAQNLPVAVDTSVSATVGIGSDIKGGFGLEVKLLVDLPELDRTSAERLVAAAHQVCPYSKAVRGNIDVALLVV